MEGLLDLGRQDMGPSRRSVLSVALFSVALTVPEWPDVVGRMETAQRGTRTRIGMSDVHTVSAMTEQLSSMDDQFGGRAARPLAATFLVNTVAPFLRADGPEGVRKAMMSAASDLCCLTGYMAVDEGLHGLAQRYYLKALELAGASEDHLTYCTTLRGTSVQAVDLGQGPLAKRLADAAAASSPQAGPRMRAFLAGQQAHAAAQTGDRRSALMYLQEAARQTWGLALDDYPLVDSGRIDKRMTDMFKLIRPHIRNHAAQALYERAREVVRPELIAV
ncbi:hypothetical protein [Streptomyces sp. NPDC012825]|uniref:hypothetical protein n=1 Tax=Streptomyces sp. NPDC012825 TaxID=3364851 RepID=UPI003696010B